MADLRLDPATHRHLVVLSDLHLGNRYCRHQPLQAFLEHFPGNATLVLNGDTLDYPGLDLPPDHLQVLQRIFDLAARQPVVWLLGNHDDGVVLPDHVPLQTGRLAALGDDLIIAHGDYFDDVMERHRWFIWAFQWCHRWRLRLGAPPIHVAQAAKHLGFLYAYLCRKVRRNAVDYAVQHGCSTILCGHVHQPEDRRERGVHYLNTGAWTEPHAACVEIRDGACRLHPVESLLATWREAGKST